MSEVHPNTPKLIGGDLIEAVYLRLDDDLFKKLDSGVEVTSEGVPTTGDPIADKWERELLYGE